MSIPLVDLSRQHAQIASQVEEGIREVMEEGDFILGGAVDRFEEAFARFSGVTHCIGVGNGTDAIEFALRALGVGPGGEVVVPANTFIATGLAVVRAGARVVLVDCDADTYLIDPRLVARAVTANTQAVIPVHLYGQMAEVEKIGEAIGDIPMLEDGAQSQGATRFGRSSGSLGMIGATSFYPGKNIGAYGDGGAVLTSDGGLADRVRRLRNFGSEVKYDHPEIGFNSRLDTVQAVVLNAKLARLAEWNSQRQEAARFYGDLLSGLPEVTPPQVVPGNGHAWHLYVIRVPERDAVIGHLNREGIGAGIHYPVPMHLHGAMSDLGYGPGDFPVAEKAAGEILSLPIFPGITSAEQERVVEVLAGALSIVGASV